MNAQTTDIATTVCAKLDLTDDQLNSLFTALPVGGFVGTDVAAGIARRYGIDVWEPLGSQLAALGVLTDDEAAWFDDAE